MSRLKKALEKAREARETDLSVIIKDRKTPPSELRSLEKEKNKKPGRREVHVTYSKTKVQAIEPQTLKKNKIFTISYTNQISDQINILRTQVLNKLEEIGGNSLLITSANPGEGKTFTTINLGVSIAQELDRTVLLVDADLRNPFINHYDFASDFFSVDVTQGLADYLSEEVEIADLFLNPGIQKLTILPSGKPLPASAELLNSPRMESLVTEIKGRYRDDRIIIIDSPSLLTCTDPVILSRYTDSILMVVEAEKTSPDQLKRAMELLNGKPLLGTLLNKAK